jgi:hypothetical protein
VLRENAAEIPVGLWRPIRQENPYRFEEKTYTGRDKLFWTKNQAHMWNDFYDDAYHMKIGFYVVLKYLRVSFFGLAILLCRGSCCAGEADVLSFSLWQFSWLLICELGNGLKYPDSHEIL